MKLSPNFESKQLKYSYLKVGVLSQSRRLFTACLCISRGSTMFTLKKKMVNYGILNTMPLKFLLYPVYIYMWSRGCLGVCDCAHHSVTAGVGLFTSLWVSSWAKVTNRIWARLKNSIRFFQLHPWRLCSSMAIDMWLQQIKDNLQYWISTKYCIHMFSECVH